MTDGARILVVDDQAPNRKLLVDLLGANGYSVDTAEGGGMALEKIRADKPDLVLLDVMMPDMSGYEVCAAIRADPGMGLLPVLMVTALDATAERVRGLECGADDFLTKPINKPELLARVRSLLRIKSLYDTVQTQAAELSFLNAGLENRVSEQLAQLERLGQLKRFFPPHLAEMIVSGDVDDPLRTRRREVTVAMLDLRGFNAFADTSEPEEVMNLLRGFHREMARLIEMHGGSLETFTGRSMMVIFNDPMVVDDPARRAVMMAFDMQHSFEALLAKWKRHGHDIALGIGISQGFATIGAIGDEARSGYGVIGRVTNVASQLCLEAAPGQILISATVRTSIDDFVTTMEVDQVSLKGFARPMAVYRVQHIKATPAIGVNAIAGAASPVRIRTLGRFTVEIGGRPLEFSRKTQKKPLDMLRVLVAHGGVRVEAATIIEELWPGAEGDAGKVSFDSNLHRLRRLIGVDDVLLMAEGRLSLDPSKCWVDTLAFEQVVVSIEREAHEASAGLGLMKEMLQLYGGHFLDSETQEGWAVAARDRLKAKFVRAVALIGNSLEARRQWDQAATLFSRALELDNLSEALYRRLMVCYRELGEPAEALNAYRRCREMLSIVLGVRPSPETEAIRATLM
ncbi:MAG: response regulator [Betaproteobacteria bacterium]